VAARVTPLVRAKGEEIGIRTVALPHMQTTVSVWSLNLASELVFVGDAGTTAASRPSHRAGVEWTNYVKPTSWLTMDADLSFSRARFADSDPIGNHIPGSAGTIISAGGAVSNARHLFVALRWRYFGRRPLTESGSVRSVSTSLLNGEIGYRVQKDMRVVLDVFNLLNRDASDIDYYYRSRLPGESLDGVTDIHTHPISGRSARLGLMVGF
jgi:outer membrane receptor protein involved in Fe transport